MGRSQIFDLLFCLLMLDVVGYPARLNLQKVTVYVHPNKEYCPSNLDRSRMFPLPIRRENTSTYPKNEIEATFTMSQQGQLPPGWAAEW